MHLVDDGPDGPVLQRFIALPVVCGGIHHYALHCFGSVITFPAGSLAAVVPGNDNTAPIWVKENFRRIKPQPAGWLEWPLNPIGVKLPRLHTWHKHVPVMVGTIGHGVDMDYRRGPGVILSIKKQQFDP